jgi:hypothetical protein
MAYLMLVVGLAYSVIWGMGLKFAAGSAGPKNTVLPSLGLLAFIGLTGMSAMAAKEAMNNPERLNPGAYLSLKYNNSIDEVVGALGPAVVAPDRATYNLTAKGLVIPSEISARLPSGENDADAVNAKLVLSIIGEPGRRNQRDTLGGKSANEGNGVSGLQIVLKENGNEVTFTEGEDWTYENGDTAETVAQKIGEAIDAHPSWIAEGSTELAPTKVIIQSELEPNLGTVGNEQEGWVATGQNSGVKVGIVDNGSAQKFRGGMDSVTLKFWIEKEAVLDGNFSMTDRLVMVGFIGDQAKAARQSGIQLTGPQMTALSESFAADRLAEEEAKKAEKAENARAEEDTE